MAIVMAIRYNFCQFPFSRRKTMFTYAFPLLSLIQRRLFNAAKKAVAKMPLRQVKIGDPVCKVVYNNYFSVSFDWVSNFVLIFLFLIVLGNRRGMEHMCYLHRKLSTWRCTSCSSLSVSIYISIFSYPFLSYTASFVEKFKKASFLLFLFRCLFCYSCTKGF